MFFNVRDEYDMPGLLGVDIIFMTAYEKYVVKLSEYPPF